MLLNIYDTLIGNDLVLHSVAQEAALAAFAALVEGGSLWVIVNYARSAGRALILPVLAVALIYQLAHLADWGKGDVILLLFLQMVLIFFGICLFAGHFGSAGFVLLVAGAILGLIAAFAKSL